jgi:ubiquinone/menaquinone biosynthesis C-methylase UbiE
MPEGEVARVRDVYASREAIADRYDPLRPDQVLIDAARRRVWGTWLVQHGRRLGDVLEVGAGSGGVLRWASSAGATSVAGVDLLIDVLRRTRAIDAAIGLVVADGRRLPFADRRFDTLICSTLFSSVLDDEVAGAIAGEMDRVLAENGVILWFDFFRNNPRNPDVRGVGRRAIGRLLPGFAVHVERVVLAPPIAHRLLAHSRAMQVLELAWPLRTHLAGVLTRA